MKSITPHQRESPEQSQFLSGIISNVYVLNALETKVKAYLRLNEYGDESCEFAKECFDQMIANPSLNLDIDASFKSPMNIDFTAIDATTVEGQKFFEIYNALKNVPEFKALFIDLFQDNENRFNVKFEIAEHVYVNNNPANAEVNAITMPDGINTYKIKINKQCLVPNGTKLQTKLENAKTIAYEGIHAFLFNKIKNPNNGISIPGFEQMDLPTLLNAYKIVRQNQHNVMFNNLTPTLSNILKALKNILTTPAQRSIVEQLDIYQVQNPQSNPAPWNWNTYFEYLSYEGLQESQGFQTAFPNNSNIKFVFNQYVAIGHANL